MCRETARLNSRRRRTALGALLCIYTPVTRDLAPLAPVEPFRAQRAFTPVPTKLNLWSWAHKARLPAERTALDFAQTLLMRSASKP